MQSQWYLFICIIINPMIVFYVLIYHFWVILLYYHAPIYFLVFNFLINTFHCCPVNPTQFKLILFVLISHLLLFLLRQRMFIIHIICEKSVLLLVKKKSRIFVWRNKDNIKFITTPIQIMFLQILKTCIEIILKINIELIYCQKQTV